MNLEDDKKIEELAERLRFSDPGPLILAIDTYEGIKKMYNENEALKLTEIICNNYYKEKSINEEDLEN